MKNNFIDRISLKARKIISLRVIIIIATLLVNAFLIFIFLRADSYFFNRQVKGYEAGKLAERDIIAEHNFEYIDRKSTARRDYELERNITSVFKVYREITDEAVANYETFMNRFNDFTEAKLTEADIESFYHDFLQRYQGLSKNILLRLYEKPSALSILDMGKAYLAEVMSEGIIDSEGIEGGYRENEIFEIWRWNNGRREIEEIRFSAALTRENIRKYIIDKNSADSNDINLIADLVHPFVIENCFYDFLETQKKRERVLLNASPVMKTILKGDVIVEKGFIITDSDMEIIRSMGSTVTRTNFRTINALIFYLFLIYFLSYILFSNLFVTKKISSSYIMLIIILAEIFLIYILLVIRVFNFPSWFNIGLLVPLPVFSIVLSLILSPPVGIIFSILMSLFVLVADNFSPFSMLFTLFSGISGVLVVKNTETRIDLIIAGMKNGFLNILFIITLMLFGQNDVTHFLIASGIAFLNGFLSGILSLGLLPIMEYILNSPTRFRLIELSDLNNPILKKMHSRAPGTFNHSLIVGNLAETACREIGANSLLARTGAYYHDIGKIDQAEYFIENQKSYNKHDDLKPSMSVSVIKSHVKIGLERAKEIGLPQEVIDIIAQHHGNGLIAYFYVQALKLEKKAKISPQDYSYTEGVPKTREAAVVLLADNIEAAVRTLKKPTPAKIEKFIWQIIMSKIETGQITESELTFRELNLIKESFVKTLTGSYHSRIEYPDQKEAEKNEHN